MSGTGVSLEAKSISGAYIRHFQNQVWLARVGVGKASDTIGNFNQDTGWNIAGPWAP